MIINLSNFGGGGGGGSYVLPIASQSTLGGVKIGDGINIDSDGTISVSGSGEAQMALALKNLVEGDEDNYKVVNESGYLYYVEQIRDDEEGIFVKVRQDTENIVINIDLSSQTAPEGETIYIVEFGDVTITLNENGELFYLDEESNEVYFDVDDDYTYGDFTFHWSNDGKDIEFGQNATSPIITVPQTGNADRLFMIATELWMANEGSLGLVKIGEGINLSEDGTISVEASEPSVIKSVSALPETAAAGDVVSYNGQMWEYKSTSGTSCVINDYKGNNTYGDIVINYYNLPTNQVLFHFYLSDWDVHRYVSYNNGVFTLWEDDEMTTSAETITEGTPFVLWSENVLGEATPRLMSLTSTENSNSNINLVVSIYGDWCDISDEHWEPIDWEDQIKDSVLYKNNMLKSNQFAQVGPGGVVPMQLAPTNELLEGWFGVVPLNMVSAVIETSSTAFTVNMNYLPKPDGYIRLTNVFIGSYQLEYNLYEDGIYLEIKDENWQTVSNYQISPNSAQTMDAGEAYESSYDFSDGETVTITFTTNVDYDVQGIPIPTIRYGYGKYNPFRMR